MVCYWILYCYTRTLYICEEIYTT